MLATASKYRSPWLQLIVFIVFALGVFSTLGTGGTFLVAKMNGISLDEAMKVVEGQSKNSAARAVMAGMQVVQFLTLFIIPSLLFAFWADPKNVFSFSGIKKPWTNQYYILVAGLIFTSLFAVALLGLLNEKVPLPQSFLEMEKKQNAAIETLVMAKTPAELLFSIFLIGVLAGVGEELFFRGCLQRILIQITRSPWAGIIITSALFSAFHFQFSGFLPRMFLGVALGALYWYSGSILPGILFHMVYNTIGVVVAYYYPEQLNKPETINANAAMMYVMGALGIAGVVYLVKRMKENSRTVYADVYPEKPASPFEKNL